MIEEGGEGPSAEVHQLRVAFRAPPSSDAPVLKLVDTFASRDGCNHRSRYVSSGGLSSRMEHATYEIRAGETEVECSLCGTRLDPMWVLMELSRCESEWSRRTRGYQELANAARDRTRTSCEHCGKQTRIKGLRCETFR